MGGANGRIGGQLGGAARMRSALANTTQMRSVRALSPAPNRNASTARTSRTRACRFALRSNRRPHGSDRDIRLGVDAEGARGTLRSCRSAQAARPIHFDRCHAERLALAFRLERASEPASSAGEIGAGARVRLVVERSRYHRIGGAWPKLEVVAKAKFRRDYTWDDICRCGATLKVGSQNGGISFQQLETDPAIKAECKVPASTMRRWCANTGEGEKWVVERDRRRRTSLPQSVGS
jgi:hypothetical protein